MLFTLVLFVLVDAETYFSEAFPDVSLLGTTWQPSSSYAGAWAVEARSGGNNILGLVTKTDGAVFSGISTIVNIIPTNTTDFVFQFEHKIQAQPFTCGGSYIRLLNEEFDPNTFTTQSPYVLTFGPDKCNEMDRMVFSLKKQNPIDNKWVEHNFQKIITPFHDDNNHLYTLILHPDDTFTIKIDGSSYLDASFKDAGLFDPPFEPPLVVLDPNERKPETWVDNELIDDPADFKPEDWDENAPKMIPENTTKPDDWKTEELWEIPNPTAVQPILWNVEEDGKWEPPIVDNPYCQEHGCGPWTPKLVPNPNYKGKWTPRQIKNPAYIGVWQPKEIPNPDHYIPENIHTISKITGVGIDIFSVKSQQWFGNFYIGNSAQEAEDFGKSHFFPDKIEPPAADKAEPPAADQAEPSAADKAEPPAADKAEPSATDKAEPPVHVEKSAEKEL